MKTYKITNISNQLHKRDVNFKAPVKIEYIDERKKKVAEIKTGQNLFLQVDTLPLSLHRLRIKGLINVSEASAGELKKINASESKPAKKPKPEKPKTSSTPKKSSTTSDSTSKSSYKKSSSSRKSSYKKSSSSSSSKTISTSSKTDTTEKETTT